MIVVAMAFFYPPYDDTEEAPEAGKAGDHAERRVLNALLTLDDNWRVFHGLNWRKIERSGESTGEIDLIIFHPRHLQLFLYDLLWYHRLLDFEL